MLDALLVLNHPNIGKVAFHIGPLPIFWYGIAYVVTILFSWWYSSKLVSTPRLWGKHPSPITSQQIDDFLIWAVVGIILGGRLGYIFFYNFSQYLADPLSVFKVWKGGMSFHGGLFGIIIAMILFARRNGFSPFNLFDVISAGAGIGIFTVRMANFINAELYGKASNLPWAVIFPNSEGVVPIPAVAYHPSQIYEGLLEGLLMFLILSILVWKYKKLQYPGFISGCFLIGYAISRILIEFVRIPDKQLGYYFGTDWITMGMMLSVPLFLTGVWAISTSKTRVLN